MRVTGGALRGRRLRAPRAGVRPTSDRVREATFMRLGGALEGARVLDLYAGSGALGIEALSRGAEHVVFVERAGAALAALRANLDTLALSDRATVVRGDAVKTVGRLAARGERFDWVFLDPPYAEGAEATLRALADAGLLAPGGRVVSETAKRQSLPPIAGLDLCDERCYGDTRIALWAARQVGVSRRTRPPMTERRRKEILALFPASFDPVTNGHLDLVERARNLFDRLVVAVAHNVDKSGGTFEVEERLDMLRTVLGDDPRVQITSFTGLLVDYAREIGARVVIRGLRALSDFEYEFEMAQMNKHMNPDVEIVFLMTNPKYHFVSSSRLKELVRFGAPVEEWVPPLVAKRLQEKLGPR